MTNPTWPGCALAGWQSIDHLNLFGLLFYTLLGKGEVIKIVYKGFIIFVFKFFVTASRSDFFNNFLIFQFK